MLMKRSKLKELVQLSTEVKLGLNKLQSTVVSMTQDKSNIYIIYIS